MEAKNFQLEVVKDRFPTMEKDIVNLFYHDLEFRAICEDYYLCMVFLSRFKKESNEKNESIEDYEMIKLELESELQERLKTQT